MSIQKLCGEETVTAQKFKANKHMALLPLCIKPISSTIKLHEEFLSMTNLFLGFSMFSEKFSRLSGDYMITIIQNLSVDFASKVMLFCFDSI